MTPLFSGRVANGKLTIDDVDSFRAYLTKFEGKDIQVSVKKYAEPRTNAENRYYWGVIVKLIADEVGITPAEAHELLKGLFLKVGIEHEGRRFEITRSTAALSIAEFEDYCERCRQWAANELSVAIPLPNEIIIGET